MFRGRCKPSCEAVRQIPTMWRKVPPGVSSFHPPSLSSSFLQFFFFLFSSCIRDKASCQTLKPPRSSSYRKLELRRGREEQGRRVDCGERQKKKKRWSKDEGCCKGGNRVFACVCVLSSLVMNVKSLSEPQGILHIPQAYLL